MPSTVERDMVIINGQGTIFLKEAGQITIKPAMQSILPLRVRVTNDPEHDMQSPSPNLTAFMS